MYHSDKIKLVATVVRSDDEGYPAETETKTTEVFSNAISATRAEFYAALEVGVKADMMFKLSLPAWFKSKLTYNGKTIQPSMVIYLGEEYDITRTFSKDRYSIELVCVRRG